MNERINEVSGFVNACQWVKAATTLLAADVDTLLSLEVCKGGIIQSYLITLAAGNLLRSTVIKVGSFRSCSHLLLEIRKRRSRERSLALELQGRQSLSSQESLMKATEGRSSEVTT